MKKIKQFSLKAMLLTIAAALTIGFTGCSDELSGDQTQGKPGYLTLNLRTIKPNQTKFAGDFSADYATVKNLNIFVADTVSGNILFSKYEDTGLSSTPAAVNSVQMRVGNLPTSAKVIVVANWGSRITSVSTLAGLKALKISNVKAFSTDNGLIMTGQGEITATDLSYSSNVNVSPVSSKINVTWKTTLGSDVQKYFDIQGIYIVNAIDTTSLPIVGGHFINSMIVPATKTVHTGFDLSTFSTPVDYTLYYATLEEENLSDANPDSIILFTYYVGENYHKAIPTTSGAGFKLTENQTNDSTANTLILIKAVPNTAGEAIYGTGARYYTYDLSNTIANNAFDYGTTNIPGWTIANGFSTKRKTNYNVNFTLNGVGTSNPFEQIRTLTVNVVATPWDYVTANVTF